MNIGDETLMNIDPKINNFQDRMLKFL